MAKKDPATPSTETADALAAYAEARQIGVTLQRRALRLAELGHSKSGADTLRAAVRVSRIRPGQNV